MAHKPEELQEVLHYTFKNPALLRIALTHTSYANESKVATTHNERLEFLGDSVLSVVVADYLFHQSGRPEGELTRMRASLVSRMHCSSSHRKFSWVSICALATARTLAADAAARALSPMRSSCHCRAVSGRRHGGRAQFHPALHHRGKTAEDDYKTRLQEVVQQDPSAVLKYEVTGETGPDHNKQFTVCVWRNGELLAEGRGAAKKPPSSTQQGPRWKSCNEIVGRHAPMPPRL